MPNSRIENDSSDVWAKAVEVINSKLDSQIFAAWIRPLFLRQSTQDSSSPVTSNPDDLPTTQEPLTTKFEVCAPNKFCCEHVQRYYGDLISCAISSASGIENPVICYAASQALIEPARKANQILLTTQNANETTSSLAHNTANESAAEKTETPPGPKGNTQPNKALVENIMRDKMRPPKVNPRFLVDGTNLNQKYNFSNFVVGSCNQFAHAVGIQVAQNLGSTYNPLFIYGGVGLGKTHLVNAIGNYCKRFGKNVLLVSSEFFVNELITAIRTNTMPQFKSRFRSLDLLIIDDIQFLTGKERTQEEFFHTFNELYSNRKQIVVTSDKVPQELVGLEERLRTRFASGLSADLQVPDFETRVAILSKKAESQGLQVGEDIIRLLAKRIDTNVRELEGALNRITALSSISNQPITLSLAEEALRALMPDVIRDVSTKSIQDFIARRFNVSNNDLVGKRRTQNIALARQVAMYLCRKLIGSSYPEIGTFFGGRDHSTVIHAFKTIEEKIENDHNFKTEIGSLERSIVG